MDPEGFTSSLFRWNPTRAMVPAPSPVPPPLQQQPPTPQTAAFGMRLGGLEGLFGAYGIRFYTAAKIAELGFTASTLVGMKDEELEEMMNSLSHIFRWELLVGERYGIKAAVRAERRRLQEEEEEESSRRRHLLLSAAGDSGTHHALDALSQEDDWTGLSEEPVQQQDQTDAAGNNGGYWEAGQGKMKKLQPQRRRKKPMVASVETDDDGNEGEDDDGMDNGNGVGGGSSGGLGTERQREHPFIVTEPGEVARGKKNGLDYLFHLYEQCREFLLQVQTIAKDRGEKCPTKGRYHMDTAQNGTPSGDLNNQILSSKEENYAAKVESAGKEILHKHKGQLRQLIHMLRQIETQVNSHQEEILQMVDDRRTFFQDFIQKSLYYLSSVHSKNHDTFPVTVKLLRVLFNNINEVLGSVDTGVNDLMQALAKNMCHPMTKYVGNLAAELKLGPCVELMNVVNEMERANADTRRELKDARERIRLAEETKIESLLKLKKAEDHVQRMTTSAKFLLPSSQNKKQAEHSITGKRIGTEGGREHEEKLLWELLSKRRKQQEPESPMGPKELIRQADTKQKPLVYIRRSTRLNSQKARPDSLIPLGLSPSARTVTWR